MKEFGETIIGKHTNTQMNQKINSQRHILKDVCLWHEN